LFENLSALTKSHRFFHLQAHGAGRSEFRFIDKSTHYHTQIDSLGTVSESSLQHHGSQALALTRHFGNLALPVTSNGNAVYFDVLSALSLGIQYRAWWR